MSLSEHISKTFSPQDVEGKWLETWEKQGYYKVNPKSDKDPFCIVMPPPNVTGALHMGHALVSTAQDILIRWNRMMGKEVFWIPGTDHAGIATQTVVERHLMAETGKTRKEFPRDEFLKHVWHWKQDYEKTIISQLKKLGSSCDWSRLRFTMDEQCSHAVRVMFKKLFDEGLIYRGDYLVNWDPVTQTALADDEVEYEEREGKLYHFRYPLKDSDGFIEIATTRPETMLGDTAIAVHPKDRRYQELIGEAAILPIMNRTLPIIADPQVDPEFGTGAVKITPGHDPLDYQLGLTHDLEMINILTPDGRINENGGIYADMSTKEAREAIVKEMDELGLLVAINPHIMRVGTSYRSKAVIEPMLSKQWFFKLSAFKDTLKEAVENGEVELIPDSWDQTYFHWINNLRDWCISRQLWWGHRIPVWYNKHDPDKILCHDGDNEPEEVVQNPEDWIQEEDVLDTWFSSALWPFSTLGWPQKTEELDRFYPNSILVTGHDILFFWVARMLIMGKLATGSFPFPNVFLHGLIYAKSYWRENANGSVHFVPEKERIEYDLGKAPPPEVKFKWEKMSKSKGNVINPLEIIESYGTDALRMALASSLTDARQIDLDRRRFEDYKNFTNKVWNGARFVFMNLDQEPALDAQTFSQGLDFDHLKLEDEWMLSLLNERIKDVNEKLSAYEFDQAASCAYEFFWKEFCAYYVEIAKPVLYGKSGSPENRLNKQKILAIVLCASLRMLHPMAPFITEELFTYVKDRLGGAVAQEGADPYTKEACEALHAAACIVSPYPQVLDQQAIDPAINNTFERICEIIYTIRNLRGEMKLPPSLATDVHLICKAEDALCSQLSNYLSIIHALVPTQEISIGSEDPELAFAATGVVGSLKVLIPLPNELKEQEQGRLVKEKLRLEQDLEKTKASLGNPSFLERAPEEVILKKKEQCQKLEDELSHINEKIAQLETPATN